MTKRQFQAQPRELRRDLVRGEDPIDDARRGGALRHAREVGGRGGLREREAALGLDLLEPGCSVFAGAGEHDADRAAAQLARKRQEQRVDWQPAARGRWAWDETERSAREEDFSVRGQHVHMVRHQARPILDLEHRHGGEPRERLREEARMVRREVLDDHVGHPGICGQRTEQAAERVDAAGRRADADHPEGEMVGLARGLFIRPGHAAWLHRSFTARRADVATLGHTPWHLAPSWRRGDRPPGIILHGVCGPRSRTMCVSPRR